MFATISEDLQYLLLYSVSGITIGIVYTLLGCVCNPRSKRFAKHKSFILPHDGNTAENGASSTVVGVDSGGGSVDIMCQSAEMTGSMTGPGSSYHASNTTPNSVIRSSVLSTENGPICIGQSNPVNRALPDIPATGDLPTDASGDNLASYADIISNSADEVDSLYTTAQNDNGANSSDHAYARIRDNRDNNNHFVDSSTENDTDDYGETRNVVVSVSTQPNSIPVSSIITIQSNPGPSNIITSSVATVHHQPHILRLQITNNPMEGPVFHHHQHHNHHHQNANHNHHHHHLPDPPLPPPEDIHRPQQHQEQQSEISYNTISVREPLAKVLTEPNDVGDVEHHYNEVEEERLSSFYEEINSGNSSTYYKINYENRPGPSTSNGPGPSTSGMGASSAGPGGPSAMNHTPMGVAFIDQNHGPMPLYSFVEKKSKRNKLPVVPSNLYTMVNKASTSKTGDHLKMNGHSPQVLERYSPPPPLPPPIHKDQNGTSGPGSKAYRNSMFATRPGSLLVEENIYQKIALSDSEKDPGYETVDKDGNDDDCGHDSPKMVDYGYEVVNNDECDPAYEIVKQPDPAYETIKNELDYGGSSSSHSGGDPNYEIIANPSSDPNSMYGIGLSVISPPDQPPHHPHHQHHHPHPLPRQTPMSNSLPFYATISNVPSRIPLASNSPRSIHVPGPSHGTPEQFRSLPQYTRPQTASLPPPHMHSILINNNNNNPNTSLIIDENIIIEHL